jgi:hypothetical protein
MARGLMPWVLTRDRPAPTNRGVVALGFSEPLRRDTEISNQDLVEWPGYRRHVGTGPLQQSAFDALDIREPLPAVFIVDLAIPNSEARLVHVAEKEE